MVSVKDGVGLLEVKSDQSRVCKNKQKLASSWIKHDGIRLVYEQCVRYIVGTEDTRLFISLHPTIWYTSYNTCASIARVDKSKGMYPSQRVPVVRIRL
jgi:hypothetical protein